MKYHSDKTGLFQIPHERKLFKRIDEFEIFIMANMGTESRQLLNKNLSKDNGVFLSTRLSTPYVKFRYVAKTKLPKIVLDYFNMRVRMAQKQNKDFCTIYRLCGKQWRNVSKKEALAGALDRTVKKNCFLMVRQRNQKAVFQLI